MRVLKASASIFIGGDTQKLCSQNAIGKKNSFNILIKYRTNIHHLKKAGRSEIQN